MTAAEFFAGMGLVRAALHRCGIDTVFANDIDKTKAALYQENWGVGELQVGDVRAIRGRDLPKVDLATASFPCVDVSLAGRRAGLDGTRSGVVYEFCRILDEMVEPPSMLMLENVPGFLTVNGGRDYHALVARLKASGYSVSHTCINAAAFVPQSRRRVFLLGFRGLSHAPLMLPSPAPGGRARLADIIEDGLAWWEPARQQAFHRSLSALQAARVGAYAQKASISYHGAYRRTRRGRAVWEVRGDEIAGALRTTQGGSGRQAVLRAGQGKVAVRWMDVAEYARLQGAGGMQYGSVSPRQAMYALGDGVCVPVVEWLVKHCMLPVATMASPSAKRLAILGDEARRGQEHPDIRLARRAQKMANLARVISERRVKPGTRRTLWVQAKRLERLAEERLEDVASD